MICEPNALSNVYHAIKLNIILYIVDYSFLTNSVSCSWSLDKVFADYRCKRIQ